MTDHNTTSTTVEAEIDIDTPCKGKGVLFMLVGPSGVGKNEIMKGVMARIPGLHQLPTATTRPMRPTEQQGREHLFVTPQVFQSMLEAGELVEHQEVYHGTFYGTPRAETQRAFETHAKLIADIEVLGAKAVKAAFPANVVSIFIAPPSPEILIGRLRKRGNMSEEEIARRLERAPMELEFATQCDYHVVNGENTLEQTIQAVSEIVQKELEDRDCL